MGPEICAKSGWRRRVRHPEGSQVDAAHLRVRAELKLLFALTADAYAQNDLPRERLVYLVHEPAAEFPIQLTGNHLEDSKVHDLLDYLIPISFHISENSGHGGPPPPQQMVGVGVPAGPSYVTC